MLTRLSASVSASASALPLPPPQDQGNRTTPSYVAFSDTERLIGEAAKNQAATVTDDTHTLEDEPAKRRESRGGQ